MGKTPDVRFASSARQSDVSAYSIHVLEDILRIAGLTSCVISSTARSPRRQAEAMYQNLEERGAKKERELYREPGQAVIRVYERMVDATREATIDAMEAKIIELGPSNVSHHACDFEKLNVFDVTYISIERKIISFERAARADSRISKCIDEQKRCMHIEIPQPQPAEVTA